MTNQIAFNLAAFATFLHSAADSSAAIAAAVFKDNGLEMPDSDDLVLWVTLASAISDRMSREDEPRFSLYDYLDALINSNTNWHDAVQRLTADHDDPGIWNELVELAQHKRDVYSS